MSIVPIPTVLPVPPAEFSQQALTLMVQVRELGRTVGGFRFAPEGRRAEIGALTAVREEFLHLASALLDVNPDLAAACKLTGNEVRECLNFKRDFGNAAAEIHLVAKGLEDTIAERLANVAERALQLYYYAKRANLKDSTESLVPHLDAMKRALGKGRPRKVKKDGPVPAAKGEPK